MLLTEQKRRIPNDNSNAFSSCTIGFLRGHQRRWGETNVKLHCIALALFNASFPRSLIATLWGDPHIEISRAQHKAPLPFEKNHAEPKTRPTIAGLSNALGGGKKFFNKEGHTHTEGPRKSLRAHTKKAPSTTLNAVLPTSDQYLVISWSRVTAGFYGSFLSTRPLRMGER